MGGSFFLGQIRLYRKGVGAIVDASMIGKFIAYYRPHRGLFLLDMLVATAASLLSIVFPYLTRNLLRSYIPDKNLTMVLTSLVLMGAIYLIMLVFNYVRIRWGHILGVRMEADMRKELFRHVQKLSFTYFDNTKTGHIMSRISNDLNMIAEVAHHAPEDLIISIVVLIGAYSFMFSFSWPLALISLIPFPFMLVWGIFYGGRMRPDSGRFVARSPRSTVPWRTRFRGSAR